MGIFQKLSTLLRSNINDAIARAENPEKMLNQVLIDMREQLAKAKQQADATSAQLEAVFPGIANARGDAPAVRFHWPSNPWVRGSYACLRPGDWTGLRGAMGEPVGRLHFAGEHCALDTQGFMEGGVESGETAATEVLAELRVGGRRRREEPPPA